MAFNLSGTVYVDEGVTPMGAGRRVDVSVAGAASAANTTTASDGTFTLAGITAASGTVLTVYLQGNTEKGVTLTTSKNATMTGVDIYQDGLSFRSDQAAVTGTAANTGDNNGDSGITSVYSSSSNTAFTLAAGVSLYVQSGQTYNPGAGVTANVSGSFSNRGTLGATPGTLNLTGSGTVRFNGGTFTIFTLNASGGTYTLADAISVGTMTLTAGTLDVSASNFQVTINGSWSATSGVFVCRQGTLLISPTVSTTRTLSGAAGNFYNVTMQGTAHTRQLSSNATITGNLTVSTGTFDVNGKTLNLAGNLANSATFTDGSTGTVNLNGTAQTISGSNSFYNLTATNSGDVITFTDGTTQTVSNSVTFQNVTLQGSLTGGWTIAMPATQTISGVTVSYSTATGNTAAADATSTNLGNNVNWTFGAVAGGGRVCRSRGSLLSPSGGPSFHGTLVT